MLIVLFADVDVMAVCGRTGPPYLTTDRGVLRDLGALKMASVQGPMSHVNGCHIKPFSRYLPLLPEATS